METWKWRAYGNNFTFSYFCLYNCCLRFGRDPQTPRLSEKTQTRLIHFLLLLRLFEAATRLISG